MGLRIEPHDLGGNGLEAYYTEHPGPAVLAVQPGLPNHIREAREVEGLGYYSRKPPRGGRKFCFAPRWEHDLDHAAMDAIRSIVEDVRPEWVEEVREAARISNSTRVIAAWCELSENVVVAILLMLVQRGELSDG